MASMVSLSLGMWLMDESSSLHLITIFVGIIAAFCVIVLLGLGVVALMIMKRVKEAMAMAQEVKAKAMPLVDQATAIARSGREIVDDATPKVKKVIENVVSISDTARDTALAAKAAVLNVQGTVTDATTRAHKQVARVDGMVTSAISTTAEIVENINHGIRVPVRKISEMAIQAKVVAEGLVDKVKSMAGSSPFGRHEAPRPTVRTGPVPPPSGHAAGAAGTPTGSGGQKEPIAVP